MAKKTEFEVACGEYQDAKGVTHKRGARIQSTDDLAAKFPNAIIRPVVHAEPPPAVDVDEDDADDDADDNKPADGREDVTDDFDDVPEGWYVQKDKKGWWCGDADGDAHDSPLKKKDVPAFLADANE